MHAHACTDRELIEHFIILSASTLCVTINQTVYHATASNLRQRNVIFFCTYKAYIKDGCNIQLIKLLVERI